MKLWQLPARALPVTLRPLGGETIISYTRRLAEANGLAPTAIFRTLGQVTPGSGLHLLDHDAWLNNQAIARLQALSAMPRHRLTTALPALRWGPPRPFPPLTGHGPALRCYRPYPPVRPACRPCALRASDGTTATPLVRPQASPLLCRRHQRWLGPASETTQTDISAAPEILTAHRRYQQLLTRDGGQEWAAATIREAWAITTRWAQGPYRQPRLRSRWQDRASKLGLTGPPTQPAVTFPEAVALAQILTDLDWRRHVAMVHDWQLDRFYWRIARRLSDPSCRFPSSSDPIVIWAARHRSRFARIRDSFWNRRELAWASTPFPEKSHFI
jgi:hypothetical protein